MATFQQNVEIVREAVEGLPEAHAAWERKSAESDILVKAHAFADAFADKSDIAADLGLTDAMHALGDLPEIPDVPAEPRVSDEVREIAQTIRKALEVAEMLNLSESDISEANDLLDQVTLLAPKVVIGKSSRKGRSTRSVQSADEERLYAKVTLADGSIVERSGALSRPDSFRAALRDVVGDVDEDKSDIFRDQYTAAQSVAMDESGHGYANHPNGSKVELWVE